MCTYLHQLAATIVSAIALRRSDSLDLPGGECCEGERVAVGHGGPVEMVIEKLVVEFGAWSLVAVVMCKQRFASRHV